MRIITGDEFGIIKECILPTRNYEKIKYRKKISSNDDRDKQKKITILNKPSAPSRSQGVVSMSQLTTVDDKYAFAALSLDGSVHTYHVDCNATASSPAIVSTFKSIFETKKQDDAYNFPSNGANTCIPVGMGTLTLPSKEDQYLVACNSHGHVSMLKKSRHEHHCNIVTTYQDIITTGTTSTTHSKNNITAFATSSTGGTCALGGRNQPIHLFCLETGKTLWKSKNVKPSLTTLLDDPVWTTALQYFSSESSSNNENLLVAGTAYKQICLYDIRTHQQQQQRRPVLISPKSLLNYRVTSLLTKDTSDTNTVIVGDASGGVYSLDLRKLNALLHRYVGPVGSVRSISSSVSAGINPYISCVGLDRYLRIFDVTRPRKSLDDVYLKQRLNCCVTFEDDLQNEIDEADDFFSFVDRKEEDFAASTTKEELEQEDRVEDYNFSKKLCRSAVADDNDTEDEDDDGGSSCSTSATNDDSADGSFNSSDENEDDEDSSQDSSSSVDYAGDSCESDNNSLDIDDNSKEEAEYEDPFAPVLKSSSSRRKAVKGAVSKKRLKLK